MQVKVPSMEVKVSSMPVEASSMPVEVPSMTKKVPSMDGIHRRLDKFLSALSEFISGLEESRSHFEAFTWIVTDLRSRLGDCRGSTNPGVGRVSHAPARDVDSRRNRSGNNPGHNLVLGGPADAA